ncbi:MAG: peptide chain release factor-like protein [Phycisphaerales bacterium]|nr:MAG: peptide chain release factor-like protein [Phycisphaerales bacterium]
MNRDANDRSNRHLELSDGDLTRQCDVDLYRASGPGGQKRNKVSSAVRLRHRPSGLIVTATESRSQHENRARALRRLRRALAFHVRSDVDLDAYRPGELLAGCISRQSRLSVGRRDHRYHRAVSEILDVLAACDMKVSTAAARIGVSTANLVAFLKADPALWARVGQMRVTAGHKPLR